MLFWRPVLVLLGTYCGLVATSPFNNNVAPTVTLDNATITGVASGSVNKWLGIPFALPPIGSLRFQLPTPIPPYNTNYSATAYGPACPQQALTLPIPPGLPAETLDYLTNTIYNIVIPSAEDCLTLNVVVPADATPESNFPVVVWIFGGGFETGATSLYDGSAIVNKAIDLNLPTVYVSMNYRLTAFGFLASEEVKQAGVGNLGLQDQRQAMRWIQQYISAFGGDPTKVTIWGESAGAISVALHMVTNGGDTEELFRAAFMESGSPIPVGDITHGQGYYDFIVNQTGCAGSSDTLDCLRDVPYDTLMDVVNQTPNLFSYQSLAFVWLPRVDGVFLTANPQDLVLQGSVANIPFITGDCDDEGTLFSLSSLNITMDSQFQEFLQTYWYPNAPIPAVQQLMEYYPEDITRGSPFNTGPLNALTTQFKRIAAFQGDTVFQAPRRFFLEQRSDQQNTWAFLSKRLKAVSILGSFHTSDLSNVYNGGDMASYLVRFVNNLDPNGVGDLTWPKWTSNSPNLLTFLDGLIPQEITQDTYRAEEMAYMTNMSLQYPI
ncbi:Alpha/Beta hydrolase protein [Suillus clintonianus]|uniref:Alpha/Beta hydrolase protein n=1 Tax=Suillus clintonianus TaxID=1904413 RepID=UPI001B86F4CB|nr:Alpha/Beta hydrolase protein [Suillus clintonianus]KAG2125805.1 Alpha/Beta hydrolase protein [Suillus clintonianus]